MEIKSRVAAMTGMVFDRVLPNYYRDGNDSVAWLLCDGRHHPIASVTVGETRLFKVRHKYQKGLQQVSIPLTHGSLLLMGDTMQEYYEHHMPKTSRPVGPRINLTFRISEPSNPIYFGETTLLYIFL